MLKGKTDSHAGCYTLDEWNSGAKDYPIRTVSGMYKQEQELAKAEEDGLIITKMDIEEPVNMACVHCAYSEDNMCDECEANE